MTRQKREPHVLTRIELDDLDNWEESHQVAAELRPAANQSTCRKAGGRQRGPRRIQINAVLIDNGKRKTFFSVMTTASETAVMKALQKLRDGGRQMEDKQ